MSENSMHGAGAYQPDKRLKGFYKQADELDDDALRALCPSYSELASIKDGPSRYTSRTFIGKGALKEVYRCFDQRTQRFIALAIPRAEHPPECFDSFVHEAWLVSSLRHPNIIKVHDAGVNEEGRPFFTMDLKGNTTLKDLVKQGTSRRPLLEIFLKICDAVAYAHAEGVIHRDLKPENIQCDRYGEVLVCDWGLGKFTHDKSTDTASLSGKLMDAQDMTLHGAIKGSLGYMAPEQIQAGEDVDERSDLFALGCLLHFILTGKAPFTGTKEEILKQTLQSERRSARREYPQQLIPKSLDAVILKAIALDPQERYSSVTQLQSDIYNYLSGHGTSAERPSLIRRGALFVKRNKTPVFIAASALVVLGISGLLFLQHLHRKEQETAQERERSQQLSTEVDALMAEYEDLMLQTEEPRRKVANRLTLAAIEKKKASIFKQPVVPFREVNALIARALDLDPDSADAQFQFFSNHCIILNFKEALKHPISPEHALAEYNKYTEAFPEFDYTEEKRPSVDALTDFFRAAKKISIEHDLLMTAILTYDADARSDKTHYAQVIGAALEYINPESNELVTEYSPELNQLSLNSSHRVRVYTRKLSGPTQLLRFLEVDTLVINAAGKFDLSSLSQASIKRLDLSNLQQPVLKKKILINGLEEVIIAEGKSKAKWLGLLLTSDGLSGPKVTVVE